MSHSVYEIQLQYNSRIYSSSSSSDVLYLLYQYCKRTDRKNGRCETVNNTMLCTNVYTQLANTGITNWLGALALKFRVL